MIGCSFSRNKDCHCRKIGNVMSCQSKCQDDHHCGGWFNEDGDHQRMFAGLWIGRGELTTSQQGASQSSSGAFLVSTVGARRVKQQWSVQWFCESLIKHHLIIICLILICNFCCLLLWNCKTEDGQNPWNHENGQHTQNRNETELPLDSGAAGSNDDNEYKGQRVLGLPGPSSPSHPFVTCCRERADLSSSLNLT